MYTKTSTQGQILFEKDKGSARILCKQDQMMNQAEQLKEILRILAEYQDSASVLADLREDTEVSPFTFLNSVSCFTFSNPGNESAGLEFSLLRDRLSVSNSELEGLLRILIKHGAVACFRKIAPINTSNLVSLTTLTLTASFSPAFFTAGISPNGLLIKITDAGRRFDVYKAFPQARSKPEPIKERAEEPLKLIFKEKPPEFAYGRKTLPIPESAPRNHDEASLELFICKSSFLGDNANTNSIPFDDLVEAYLPIAFENYEDVNLEDRKKIKKGLKDATRRINGKAKRKFNFEIFKITDPNLVKIKGLN